VASLAGLAACAIAFDFAFLWSDEGAFVWFWSGPACAVGGAFLDRVARA